MITYFMAVPFGRCGACSLSTPLDAGSRQVPPRLSQEAPGDPESQLRRGTTPGGGAPATRPSLARRRPRPRVFAPSPLLRVGCVQVTGGRRARRAVGCPIRAVGATHRIEHMPEISRAEVAHLADLARIDLS